MIAFASAAGASATTLLWDGAFPLPVDGSGFNGALAEARGWSAITLIVAIRVLAYVMMPATHGSLFARLVWLGALVYVVYTYLELAVSPPFSALYLVYVLTFACAIPALLMGIGSLDVEALRATLEAGIPRRAIATFALVVSAGLGLAWLPGILSSTFAADFGWPEREAAIGHVVHALDLGLQVPLAVATGSMLLARRAWGYVLAPIFLVNSVCMGLALVMMVATSALAADRSLLEAGPFVVLPLVAIALSIRFFRGVERAKSNQLGPSLHASEAH
jgi:hypothetical protein